MPARKETRGSGLTASEAWSFEGDLTGDEEAEQKRLLALHTVDGRLDFLEGECGRVLERVGLPSRTGNFLCDSEGNWEVAGELRSGWTYTISPWTIAQRQGHKIDSSIGFAARMLEDIHWLRDARAKGNTDRALMMMFYLGHKVASSGIKTGHADKTRSGPRNDSRNLAMARRFQARRAVSRKSDSALKAEIGREYSVGRSTAIEAINRGLQILSEEERTRTG